MKEVYINLKDINSDVLKYIFINKDLVSVEELLEKLEEFADVIEEQAE